MMSDQEKSESQLISKQEKGISKGKKNNKREKVNSTKNNDSTGTNSMHNTTKIINNSIPLTRKHQVHVGTPRGVINSSNPNGYSDFQHKLMSSLQKSEMNLQSMVNSNQNILNRHNMFNNNNVNNGNFETWNNVSLQPFNNDNNENSKYIFDYFEGKKKLSEGGGKTNNRNALHLLEKNISRVDWLALQSNKGIFVCDFNYYKERMNTEKRNVVVKNVGVLLFVNTEKRNVIVKNVVVLQFVNTKKVNNNNMINSTYMNMFEAESNIEQQSKSIS